MTDWEELYAHVIAATGWTWDYISENVDLPRLEALNRYWADMPPLHSMVAGYFGFKPKQKAQKVGIDEQQFIPAQTVSSEEFDNIIKSKGLST